MSTCQLKRVEVQRDWGGPGWASSANTLAQAGPKCWANLGHTKHNILITLSNFRLCSHFSHENQPNLLKTNVKTSLQPWLHMVCHSDRPAGPNPPLPASLASFWNLFAPRLGMGLLVAASFQIATLKSVAAQDWTQTASALEWSRVDRFSGDGEIGARQMVERVAFVRTVTQSNGSDLDRLLNLIGRAEAPAGYDAVQHSATILPPKPASQMTLGEIAGWIRATPNQHHAIGRYQVIPKTLGRVSEALGMTAATPYDRRAQDKIGRYLIMEAGYKDFRAGSITLSHFMDRLAKVWAGLPLANGRSAYHGYAGNRATITRKDYDLAMASIFPQKAAQK